MVIDIDDLVGKGRLPALACWPNERPPRLVRERLGTYFPREGKVIC